MIQDNDPLKVFGHRLRKLRKSRGWTQDDMAEASGFHRNYIGMAERGERNVSLKNITIFARVFEISVSELLEELWIIIIFNRIESKLC